MKPKRWVFPRGLTFKAHKGKQTWVCNDCDKDVKKCKCTTPVLTNPKL